LCAGEAALSFEQQSTESMVAACMALLRRCFGKRVPEPISTHCTAWQSDEFAKGSYSYVGVGAR
jgi:lysine-specific histone demethylase 1